MLFLIVRFYPCLPSTVEPFLDPHLPWLESLLLRTSPRQIPYLTNSRQKHLIQNSQRISRCGGQNYLYWNVFARLRIWDFLQWNSGPGRIKTSMPSPLWLKNSTSPLRSSPLGDFAPALTILTITTISAMPSNRDARSPRNLTVKK